MLSKLQGCARLLRRARLGDFQRCELTEATRAKLLPDPRKDALSIYSKQLFPSCQRQTLPELLQLGAWLGNSSFRLLACQDHAARMSLDAAPRHIYNFLSLICTETALV